MTALADRLAAISSHSTCRLTHRGRKSGKPYQVTIWFEVDGDAVYLETANAKRQWVRNVQANPQVSFAVGGETFTGTSERVRDTAEERHVMDLVAAKYWYLWPFVALARAWFPFDDSRAHRIQAGADFFLMPSRFEPCGLSQLEAMRYGTLPIVRATGGLVDTVANYDEGTGAGTGFVFRDLRPDSLADTIGWAVSTWHNRRHHVDVMRRRAMAEDHSWNQAAREYSRLYLAAYARRRGHEFTDVGAAERNGVPRAAPRNAPRASAVRVPATRHVTRTHSMPAMPSDRLPPLPARLGRATAARVRS
jgi:deazaflavin-dependent oxidoreductase (nitroreductase family)